MTSPSVTVTAVFDLLDGSPAVPRPVTLIVRGDYIHMRGGPTGYESAPLRGLQSATADWYACLGTRGSWARCVVPLAELRLGLAVLTAEPKP